MSLNIENDKNVYILGAGFSMIRGLPGIQNFMLRLRDAHPWLISHNRDREAEAVERVIQYRIQSAAAAYRIPIDLENIEELFSLADAGKDVLSRDIRVAIAATLDFCNEMHPEPTTDFECSEVGLLPPKWKVGNQRPIRCVAPTYEFFVQALLGRWAGARPKSAFITFNYDCLVEVALKGLGIPFRYGFSTERSCASDRSAGATRQICEDVSILKLHGSVNWMRPKSRSGSLNVVDTYRDVCNVAGTPELVPPTWRKLFARELMEIWKLALDELKSATRIVVLGFSIPETDLHFKYLLAAGLRENVSLREIVFVDKNPDAIKIRAKRLFGNDMDRRPGVRIIGRSISSFIGVGQMQESAFSIGRGVPVAIQNIQHSVW